VVLIDEDALRSVGRWPWERAQLAHLVERVFSAGAKGVVLDLLLPDEQEGDKLLARALGRGPAVLAAGVDEAGHWLMPNRVLQATAVGHVSFDLDRDGVVRRFSSTKQMEGRALPALPVAAARLGNTLFPVPVGVMMRPGFRTRPIPVVGAAFLVETQDLGILRDRIVFLGTSAAGVGDRFISPVSEGGSPEPGVLIEAISAEAILSGDILHRTSPLINALLTFGLGLLGTLLLANPGRSTPWLLSGLVLAPLLVATASLHVLDRELAPLTVLLALVLVGTLEGLGRSRRNRRAMSDARSRITELERLQVGLSEIRKQDAEARRVVAHELKTPLTSVRGLAQLLAQFDLSETERNRVAKMVVSETSRLAEMVDALLDLERLRLRDFEREASPLDFSTLVSDRAEVFMTGTGRRIEATILPGLWVRGEKALLDRVVENLVSNALKFSPAGSPVRIGVSGKGSQALLEVEDRGPGIPIEERKRIFGRFARGSSQDIAAGLGLGLALVADVVAWHEGTVEAAEGRDGGSLFRVRLPLTPH